MTDPLAACLTPSERAEMEAHANAIGCVWVAAREWATRPNPATWARLYRTLHKAAQLGVDEPTLRQTMQLGKEPT